MRSVLRLSAWGLAVLLAALAAEAADPGGADIALGDSAISVSPRRISPGQGVHFAVDPVALKPAAEAAGVDLQTFRREAEYYWRFSDSEAENYDFTALPPDMRAPRRAGAAAGPFAAHVYVTPGVHRIALDLWFRGVRHTATTRIRVAPWNHRISSTGVVDPKGDFSGAPRHGQSFTDIDDALAALNDGRIDRLLLRRGRTFRLDGYSASGAYVIGRGYSVGSERMIAAFGAPGDDPPVIRPVFGEEGLWRFREAGRGRGDGVRRRFPIGRKAPARIAVYVDGALQREGHDYQRAPDAVLFSAAPEPGASVFILHRKRRGEALATLHGSLFRIGGRNAVVRDIAIRGPYDPSDPGVFDPERLDTFEHAIHWQAFRIQGANNVTLFNVAVSGLRDAVLSIGAGDGLFLVGCDITDWHNYGVFFAGHARTAIVGCDIRQNLAARNGPGSKSENTPGVPNHADHGPIRSPNSVEQVVNRNRLDSRTTWTAKSAETRRAQPIARLAQSAAPGASYAFSENHTTGGASVFGGGAPNSWVPVPAADLIHGQNNIMIGSEATWSFVNFQTPVTSINNYFVLPRSARGGGFTAFAGLRKGSFMARPDLPTDPPLSINDSFVFLDDRPGERLVLGRPALLSRPGLHNVVSRSDADGRPGGFLVRAARATVTVPVKVSPLASKGRFHWRIWRQPPGAPALDARAFATLPEQSHAYRLAQRPTGAVRRASSLTIQSLGPAFRAGETIWVTRERLLDEATGRFFPNNRRDPVEIPAPIFRNPLILIMGEWGAFQAAAGGPALDPARFRPGRFAPLSPFFQPSQGSRALGAAEPPAAARDLTGALRPAQAALGALESESDLVGWDPLPATPSGVSVALRGPITAGRPLTTQDVTLRIADPGEPPLSSEDVRLVLEARRADADAFEEVGAGYTPEMGDVVRATASWAHLVTGFALTRSAEHVTVAP